MLDFYMRLTAYHSLFRSVGVNYNQVVKLLYRNFSEKKAAASSFVPYSSGEILESMDWT
jgi:hypothetical protein